MNKADTELMRKTVYNEVSYQNERITFAVEEFTEIIRSLTQEHPNKEKIIKEFHKQLENFTNLCINFGGVKQLSNDFQQNT